ncbi:YrhK family protein [Halomonas sp. McH1-25]|uniref:YrhK family protein n=1 Tax=unclassified Halomonas TaxID=2609666 RepID=UPI001EF44548|nr:MULTISPECIES: YrhK family protein [unclassified Halomonas]MCG7599341.1 YrhK family protein [Halomonas sp. McH1-25]MCP1343833.1 YrhK family protein [Halomonas sp. FL8]MCP1361122.1 YrhK family protein [Halomonas sp. BBD45]MCP1363829.1 YrhK family protein [Halomonas sp. BBD48]
MPHQITNRRRSYRKAPQRETFLWEGLNASAYVVGAASFVVGSVFFLPAFEKHAAAGAWLFILGSLIYLTVTANDFLETVNHYRHHSSHGRKTVLEFVTSTGYVIGCVLFLVGSAFFLPRLGLERWGAWCFIVGSGLFTIGATINVTQITQAGSMVALQLLNAVAISFVIGSILFIVASIPYLWPNHQSQLAHTLHTYLAAQFIFASLLFLAGGMANFYRAYRNHRFYQRKSNGE